MAQPVTTKPFLAQYFGNIMPWAIDIVQDLFTVLSQFATRINLSYPKDGTEALATYTFAQANVSAFKVTGNLFNISDSTTATPGANIIAGGGTHNVLTRWNGANFTVVGI